MCPSKMRLCIEVSLALMVLDEPIQTRVHHRLNGYTEYTRGGGAAPKNGTKQRRYGVHFVKLWLGRPGWLGRSSALDRAWAVHWAGCSAPELSVWWYSHQCFRTWFIWWVFGSHSLIVFSSTSIVCRVIFRKCVECNFTTEFFTSWRLLRFTAMACLKSSARFVSSRV